MSPEGQLALAAGEAALLIVTDAEVSRGAGSCMQRGARASGCKHMLADLAGEQQPTMYALTRGYA